MQLGAFAQYSRAVFCSSQACSNRFGLYTENKGGAAAYVLGTYGFVIGNGAWQPHFVKHELIHHLQSERLDLIHAWRVTPRWFIEGMATDLSNDPRVVVPYYQEYRKQFRQWYSAVGPDRLWAEAAGVDK